VNKKKIGIVAILLAMTLLPFGHFIGVEGPLPTSELPAVSDEAFTIAPTALGDIDITAIDSTKAGVAIYSGFLITSEVQTLTEEHLYAYLSVRSGEDFTLEAQPDNAFLLRFDENLANNQVFNFVYSPPGRQVASHAFQTKDIFRITATTPANNTHEVPVNTGIEITFSQELIGNFEEAFVIVPMTEGRFFRRGNTYIFTPASLDSDTTYTITIQCGLESVTGEVLAEKYTFSFTTQWGEMAQSPFSISGDVYETFLPWNEVFIALDIFSGFSGRDFYVSLYTLQAAEHFIHFDADTPKTLVDTFEVEAREFANQHDSFFYLFLERTLPEGYYVAEIRSIQDNVNAVLHKFIQVSALSVYSVSINGEAVFWVHDAATGQPANGAQVNIDGITTTTDNDGIAIVDVAQNHRAAITVEYGNYLAFAYTMPMFGQRELLPSDRFLSYMYTDRPRYRPNDTVDVFGVIKPRHGHTHSPDDVFTLHIGNIVELPIELDAFNSFAVRVPVTNMRGYMDVEVAANGERFMSAWVRFYNYTNLDHVLEGSLDRIAYALGEYAEGEIFVTTFADLPVEGLRLRHGNPEETFWTTDSDGRAAGRLPITEDDNWSSWQPRWAEFWFTTVGDTDVSQNISLPYIVVPRDIMMEHEYAGGSTATITTSQILIDRINGYYANISGGSTLDPDIFRGAPVDVDFTVLITRHVTTRRVLHQNYDYINRRTINVYEFNTTESLYRTVPGRTTNGRAKITDLPVSNDPLINYAMEIRYNDSSGRETVVGLWHRWHFYRQESAIRHFGLALEDDTLGIGETTQISLMEGSRPWWPWQSAEITNDGFSPITSGQLLTIVARDNVLSTAVSNPQNASVMFTEEMISSVAIFGAYFDGQYIFPVETPATVTFDHTQRELDIRLDFDQVRYKPGDEVTANIQTSMPNAQVLISVVDETSLPDHYHEANFLSRLYQSARISPWAMEFYMFASHRQHEFGTTSGDGGYGGNGGGSEDGTFRENFVDNPIFEVVQTDSSGNGSLTFILPDQVTSWRVTAIGLTQDGYAGDVRENITSHLDFYIDAVITSEFIAGDDIVALVRMFGSELAEIDVTYSVLQDGETIHTGKQTSRRRAIVNVGKLDAGAYVIQITATFGDERDAIELPFTVAETGLILPLRATRRLDDDSGAIDSGAFSMRPLPVRVTLTNANIGPIVNILNNIRTVNSYRTDYIAANAYIDYFFGSEPDFDALRAHVQAHSGGIPQLIYEDADFYYTARFAAIFPNVINARRLSEYIQVQLAEAHSVSPTMRAAALLALAGVGEPVLFVIQDEVGNLETDDDMTRLYLAAALIALGDDSGALVLMDGFVAPQNLSGVDNETVNTLLLFINTTLDPQAAWAHVNRGYDNLYVSDVAERVNFVRTIYLLGETVSEVQYELNNITHTVRLENFNHKTLHLTQAQFAALNLTPVSGATDFHIEFYGSGAENWSAGGNRINIQRSMVRDGDLFRIDFYVELPPDTVGFFTIYDRLPSNMRFVSQEQTRRGNNFWVNHIEQQLVEISFWQGEGRSLHRTINYYAMELFEANMVLDTTLISNGCTENHLWGTTE